METVLNFKTPDKCAKDMPFFQKNITDNTIQCHWCGLVIYGMYGSIIEQFIEDQSLVDWVVQCPHCGKPIRKRDMFVA